MADFGGPLYQATVDASAAQTDTVLVSAVVGKRVKIAYLFAMADTAMTLTLENKGGGTRDVVLWKAYLAANSGFAARAHEGQFLTMTEEDAALVVTTSTAGNIFVSILYTYE
jgi:hypothetical protein